MCKIIGIGWATLLTLALRTSDSVEISIEETVDLAKVWGLRGVTWQAHFITNRVTQIGFKDSRGWKIR